MEFPTERTAEKESTVKMLWKLFCITFLLSATTFGGGFVIIGMMRQKFVTQLHLLEEDEMLDMAAIAQSAPGPLAVNMAVTAGYRLKKLPGALVCMLGAILPPILIIGILFLFYHQFKDNPVIAAALQMMRAGVAAVIVSVTIDLAGNVLKTRSVLWIGIMVASFVAVCFFQVDSIVIILICGLAGLIHVCLSGGEKS